MAAIPQYLLPLEHLPQMSDVLASESLDARRFGAPNNTPQGIEQVWICSDGEGQLFSFSTLEVNDKNLFGLKVGTVYLEIGPREKTARKRTRKDVEDALQRFEQALIGLGGRKMPRRQPGDNSSR